jgi:glucose/arabinose dehydrogenase
MILQTSRIVLMLSLACLLGSCGDSAKLPEQASTGPNPPIPEPVKSWIPTVNIATAEGWPAGAKPHAAQGLAVSAFATGLDHPRWLYSLPNGDILVAETNAPGGRNDNSSGIKGKVSELVQKWAGADVASPNRISLLRDADGDGVAETKTTFISELNSPFGMALIGDDLYVANTDSIVKFKYAPGATHVDGKGEKIADLPAGTINHHWTKNIIAGPDGSKLYATVGSNSNVAENGIVAEDRRAGILEIDLKSGQSRVFASGLRNPNGMDWEPQTKALWVTVNERDELGSDLVPDYMTAVKDGAFYGWPYSYYGQHVDTRAPERPDMVAKAIMPDYALGNHTASLGLTFSKGDLLPAAFRSGIFIGQHGSWNRKPLSGYKVIFIPFTDGHPAGSPVDVLTGFVGDNGKAQGRPVGVLMDGKGALLVADDVGNAVWRVTNSASTASRQ